MIKPLTLAIALTLTVAVNADTDCNVAVREGSIVHLANPSEVEFEKILTNGKTETKSIQPKDGNVFAVVTLKLAAGRSVGLYDFALKPASSETEFKMLGLMVNDGPFQRKTWEVRASGDTKVQWEGIYEQDKKSRKGSEVFEPNSTVKLLFEVPAGKQFNLVSLLLDKSLQKEYGVKQVLDFDNMSNAPVSSKPEAKAGNVEENK
ncbi:MAG: hypothetical protein NE334_20850 [Lentisphaeraceae bacterium]|nr:hypothetical protein [Lentisphaeraceae bacterium]